MLTNGRKPLSLLFVLSVFALGSVPHQTFAQSLWLPRDTNHAILVEMARGSIETIDQELFSSAYFIGGRISVSDQFAVVAEIPYARFDYEPEFFQPYYQVGSSMGNVYLGLETKSATKPWFVEVGVRPPTSDEDELDALFIGAIGDVHRREAFAANQTSFHAAFNVHGASEDHVQYRLRLAPMVTIPTEQNGQNTELYAKYAFEIGYARRLARVGVGANGFLLLTEKSPNLGARGANQIDLHADFLEGPLRPGVGLRLPTTDFAAAVPVSIAFTLAYVR